MKYLQFVQRQVFHLKSFEDLSAAMKMLGLNPMEQEIVDLTNEITRKDFYASLSSVLFINIFVQKLNNNVMDILEGINITSLYVSQTFYMSTKDF